MRNLFIVLLLTGFTLGIIFDKAVQYIFASEEDVCLVSPVPSETISPTINSIASPTAELQATVTGTLIPASVFQMGIITPVPTIEKQIPLAPPQTGRI